MSIQSYRDLQVWKKSIALVKNIYFVTKRFPTDERYGLTSQVRRSAASIPANIAEGRNRGTKKEFMHFLNIAYGSLGELETHLIIAQEVEILPKDTLEGLLKETSLIGRMLNGLKKSLSDTRNPKPDTPEGFQEENVIFLSEEELHG